MEEGNCKVIVAMSFINPTLLQQMELCAIEFGQPVGVGNEQTSGYKDLKKLRAGFMNATLLFDKGNGSHSNPLFRGYFK